MPPDDREAPPANASGDDVTVEDVTHEMVDLVGLAAEVALESDLRAPHTYEALILRMEASAAELARLARLRLSQRPDLERSGPA